MTDQIQYELDVNGQTYPVDAPVDRNLLTVLRNDVGLTGTKEGCDDCECGACMVLVDGQPVNSCSFLAAQAQGRSVTTVEGVGNVDRLHRNPAPTREEIGIGLSGNLCRCTGYAKILDAVAESADRANHVPDS